MGNSIKTHRPHLHRHQRTHEQSDNVKEEIPVAVPASQGEDADDAPLKRPKSRSSSIRIGAFNVRRFGVAKMKDAEAVQVLIGLVKRYDVLLVQEIVDASGEAIEQLLDQVNRTIGKVDDQYMLVISPRLGRSSAKEQYAFLYRQNAVAFESSSVYSDPGDLFIREPFSAKFSLLGSKRLSGGAGRSFVLLGVHTQPTNAVKEIDLLHDACAEAVEELGCENVILLGDFNAGGDYVRKSDWTKIRLRNDPQYHWLIADTTDTTATRTTVAYDRIVVFGDGLLGAVKKDSALAFRYDEAANLSEELLLRVSDHYPVEVSLKLRTKSSNKHDDSEVDQLTKNMKKLNVEKR